MKKTNTFIFCLAISFSFLNSKTLREVAEQIYLSNPEAYKQFAQIIEDNKENKEEALNQLLEKYNHHKSNLEDKMTECVDDYVRVSLDLEKRAKGYMVMYHDEEGHMLLNKSSDIYKNRLYKALKEIDNIAKMALAYTIFSTFGDQTKPEIHTSLLEKAQHIILQNKTLCLASSVAAISGLGWITYKINNIKKEALNKTPLSEWDIFDDNDQYSLQRSLLLSNIEKAFPSTKSIKDIYDPHHHQEICTSSIEAFLEAAKKEEILLNNYLQWECWSRRLLLKWILPFSEQETKKIKTKLKHIKKMLEIV
jgi:Fe-S-cluster containining protein